MYTACYWRDTCFLDFSDRQIFQPQILNTGVTHTAELVRFTWLKKLLKHREWNQPLIDITIRL
ncbi:hypothetical protein PCANB_001446 [Pneumocystis canis]|nr:hypothetical protein PCANB_001446 [Pneumocystis canis]